MFIIFEKLRYRGQVLLKLRAVEVAIHLTEYRLDQPNNKHTRIALIWQCNISKAPLKSNVC